MLRARKHVVIIALNITNHKCGRRLLFANPDMDRSTDRFIFSNKNQICMLPIHKPIPTVHCDNMIFKLTCKNNVPLLHFHISHHRCNRRLPCSRIRQSPVALPKVRMKKVTGCTGLSALCVVRSSSPEECCGRKLTFRSQSPRALYLLPISFE